MKKNKILITVLSLLIIVPLLFFSGLYIIQPFIVFPKSGNSSYEDFYSFENSEKVNIDGKYSGFLYLSPANSGKTLIYFGGNMQTSLNAMDVFFADENYKKIPGYNFLTVDIPGYGNLPGKPGDDSIHEMADAVLSFVKADDRLNKEIDLMGFSIGTGAASYASADPAVNKLILAAPYDCIRTVYNDKINVFHGPVKLIQRYELNSAYYAEQSSAKVLIFASLSDETIPYESSVELSKHFKDVQLITVGGSHNSILNEETWEKAGAFLAG